MSDDGSEKRPEIRVPKGASLSSVNDVPVDLSDLRRCYECGLPIPDDEKAIQAKTRNAWKHFECWYDGWVFPRDPATGERTVKA